MAVGSTTAGIATSLMTRPEPSDHLRTFYERAHPPGFWAFPGQSPERVRSARRRLGRGLLAMAATAASLFMLLGGLGSWLVGSAPPSAIGNATAWIALQLAIGTALIPVWWRLGFAPSEA
jgi:solute:Na+ symporter, SSS family